MLTRRHFLDLSLKTSAFVSLAPTVPLFLARTARAAVPAADDRILVIIQLDGGNDGINTVVPYADEGYEKHRRALRIPKDEIIKLDDQVGLHPRMRACADLVEDGRLAIVQGAGYPNPNRSHFESMAIWHEGSPETEAHDGHGWLGEALSSADGRGNPDAFFIGDEAVPVALRGRRANTVALATADDLRLNAQVDHLNVGDKSAAVPSDLADYVRRSVVQAYRAADELAQAASPDRTTTGPQYPGTQLAENLHLIAKLIRSGAAARVYYTIQSGYDTHSVQLPTHARLLAEFSGALRAFLDDLRVAQLGDRIVVLAFSELGRRVAENGSLGTDHGTAGPVFVAGESVQPGLVGAAPSLTDLEDGDVKMQTDFRQVYATLLSGWLGLPRPAATPPELEPLPLIRDRQPARPSR
jgi:uncharacterized protein (DUF1501 family)